MRRYKALTRTFINAISMSKPQDKRRKHMMMILAFICVFFLLIPVCTLTGVIVKIMTDILIELSSPDAAIVAMLLIITLFSLVFGFNVILNEFYFSNDIEYILPLPVKASELVGAKFTASVIGENMMQCILVISCLIGYFCSVGFDFYKVFISIIGIATLPVLPMVYGAIVSIIAMSMTKFINSKETVQKITIICLILMLIGSIGFIGSLSNFDIELFVTRLVANDIPLFNFLKIIFPNVTLFMAFVSDFDIIALLLYILLNVVAVLLMLCLAEWKYFDGVLKSGENSKVKKKSDVSLQLRKILVHSPMYSYILKEIRILVRTPIFLSNCVIVNYIWPVFVYAVYKLQKNILSVDVIRKLYMDNNFTLRTIMVFGIISIAIIITAAGSISSGALSREGKHFSFIKYIPMSYEKQWLCKVIVGLIFPISGIAIYFIPTWLFLGLPVTHMLMILATCILAILFVVLSGIHIDSIQPKLIWDGEMSALRENYNSFYSMGIAIIYDVIISVFGIIFYKLSNKNFVFTMLVILAVLLLTNIVMYSISYNGIYRNISEQEEC